MHRTPSKLSQENDTLSQGPNQSGLEWRAQSAYPLPGKTIIRCHPDTLCCSTSRPSPPRRVKSTIVTLAAPKAGQVRQGGSSPPSWHMLHQRRVKSAKAGQVRHHGTCSTNSGSSPPSHRQPHHHHCHCHCRAARTFLSGHPITQNYLRLSAAVVQGQAGSC